ncbi:MAG TPA: hypothetical protein VHD56_18770 [Tepidisphaeraceae bacterium]|nr:hypothetical protein [Tepidisphaeraceae bacterium]
MQLIDEETRARAINMLEKDSDDWRSLAIAGGVAPQDLQRVLDFGVFNKQEQRQFELNLEAYGTELRTQLVVALADLLKSGLDFERDFGNQVLNTLLGSFWRHAVLPSTDVHAAVEKAVEAAIAQMPVPA